MKFFKNKPHLDEGKTDRIAVMIARGLISWQIALSKRLNQWINRYTVREQHILLLLFFAATTAGLTLSLLTGHWKVPFPESGNYLPAHIGKPSESSMPGHPVQKTDSFTVKK